jgi:hypothetical protein
MSIPACQYVKPAYLSIFQIDFLDINEKETTSIA